MSEDVAQEAFLALWTSASSVRDGTKLRAWLRQTTRNLAKRALRGQRRETRDEEAIAKTAAGGTPFSVVAAGETSSLLRSALEDLPETYRETMVLFYRDDQKIPRIAEALELSIAAVKQRLSRGRRLLRDRLEPFAAELAKTAPTAAFAAIIVGAAAARSGVASAAGAKASTTGKLIAAAKATAFVVAASATLIAGLILYSSLRTDDKVIGQGHSEQSGPSPALVAKRKTAVGDALAKPSNVAVGLTLEGQVVNQANEPVAGAWIVLGADADSQFTFAEDDGSFAFSGVSPGDVKLRASRGELVSATRRLNLDSETEPVILRASRGVELTVELVDADTLEPISQALVVVGGLGGTVESPDASGRVHLVGLEPRATFEIEVHAKGYAVAREPVLLAAGPAKLNRVVTLVRGLGLSGIVVDARGKPIPGAQVRVERPSASQDRGAETTTDGGGRFNFVALRPGEYRLSAEYAEEEVAIDELIELGETGTLEYTLRFETIELAGGNDGSSGELSGTVVDQDGNPVAGATVRANRGLNSARSAITNSAGNFRFAGVADKAWTLRATWPGEPRAYAYLRQDTVSAKPGKAATIVLQRPGKIRGEVMLGARPAKDVWVAISTFEAGVQSFAPAIACSKNLIELDTVPPGTYVISTFGPNFELAIHRNVVVKSDETTKLGKLAVSKGRTVTGRVVSKTGRAVAGARVLLAHPKLVDALEGVIRNGSGKQFAWKSGGGYAFTDRAGRFTIRGVSADARAVTAVHKRHGRSDTVTVGADPIALKFEAQTAIRGILLRGGKPVAKTSVTLVGKTTVAMRTSKTGRFRYDGISPGKYSVRVSMADIEPSGRHVGDIEVKPGVTTTHDIDFDFDIDTVEVTFAKPSPKRGVLIVMKDAGSPPKPEDYTRDEASIARVLVKANSTKVEIKALDAGAYYACPMRPTSGKLPKCHRFELAKGSKTASITIP